MPRVVPRFDPNRGCGSTQVPMKNIVAHARMASVRNTIPLRQVSSRRQVITTGTAIALGLISSPGAALVCPPLDHGDRKHSPKDLGYEEYQFSLHGKARDV